MLVLVTGGAASGKSAHAERLLCAAAPAGERLYLATMQPFGEAAARRITRHRELRRGKGFVTAERCLGLAGFAPPRRFEGVLLECLPNLLANEVFSDGVAYPEETMRYLRALAGINRALAAHAGQVYESVCGILCRVKG